MQKNPRVALCPPIFSLTTPIFYVNDVPHVGHAYTAIATDMIAWWHRGRGESVYFLTGTDEHGEKILRTAIANGTDPQQWVDTLVDTAWKPVLSQLALSHDDFIRTTDHRHINGVKKFLDVLRKNGMIYSGVFTGHYCIGCEEYKQAADLITLPDGTFACALHAIAVETNTEENYFFAVRLFRNGYSHSTRADRNSFGPIRFAMRWCRLYDQGYTTCRSLAQRSTGVSNCRGTATTFSTSGVMRS